MMFASEVRRYKHPQRLALRMPKVSGVDFVGGAPVLSG